MHSEEEWDLDLAECEERVLTSARGSVISQGNVNNFSISESGSNLTWIFLKRAGMFITSGYI